MKIAGYFYKFNEYNFTTEPHTTIEKSRTSMIKQLTEMTTKWEGRRPV